MAGRPRKPSKIHELSGAYKQNPQRRRGEEPEPEGEIGGPPKHFNIDQIKAWEEIVSISPPGVMFNSDRLALEMFACLLVEYRANPAGFHHAKLIRLESMCGKFGMTPSDRSKIIVTKKQPKKKGFAALNE